MTREKNDWVWMPHPGHFICASHCRFVLNTAVAGGKYIVSTVGEYVPDSTVRKILFPTTLRGDEEEREFLRQKGYQEIGWDRKYETMVFKAKPSKQRCCPFVMEEADEQDMRGYNDPGEAYEGHLEMCEKWDKQ